MLSAAGVGHAAVLMLPSPRARRPRLGHVLGDLPRGDIDVALMDVRPVPTGVWFAGTGR